MSPHNSDSEYVLTFSCPQEAGIVHSITGILVSHGGDIIDLRQFDDQITGHFFFRAKFCLTDAAEGTVDALRSDMTALAKTLDAEWLLRSNQSKQQVLVMVSKFEHCLNDLLFRTRVGEIPAEIVAVVSNHPDHRQLVEWHGIPFFHIPITADTKPEAEKKLLEIADRFEVDLVVLARYMQILSDDLSRELTGRAINIHHSFLPSFKGAKPYHQAWERGVKTVGATAHYVNHELDEGPIIAQQVQAVDHALSPEDLVAIGRDSECKALADAVKWHCESRVFLNRNRTVVLR
ncbi:formyltetrahydrofolate deformylase [Leucobacter coleopterorum]|uniref:Formyltetrahydrofolate deformylase n=1 Tax=Leucobacter coleopterorum TaxID=2714933 RepID=A0ABX6JV79_9MICO|nr:formyltetrahydrofolate deformylase [Leucobacter coleopterorum]QIM18216.1 formyltetrahydrofolate deformylase [Leucobacter coleopterorum]